MATPSTSEPSVPASGWGLVGALCAAEVLTMLGTFAFPALLPDFVSLWALSNTEAGWISGVYFGAYALAVPVLVSLTDRVDVRRIWLVGAGLTAASAACSATIGFLAGSAYWVVAWFSLLYAAAVQLDSAALTTGAVQAATAGLRGATMALHSLLGFGAAFLGPVAVGAVLDLAGGRSSATAWGLAFASLAAVGLLGPLALLPLRSSGRAGPDAPYSRQ